MTVAAPSREEVQDPGWSPSERKEELQALSSEEKEFLRNAAKNSLYILSKGILGYPDVNPVTHKEFCERASDDSKNRRLFLMPRAHLKSTLKTIADPIRLVLRNPDNCAILIASETSSQAQKFLREIKNHWERNDVLRDLFPEYVPEKFTGPGTDWSAGRASLATSSVSRQAHWETIGVGGAPTGNHYTHIICDDLIGLEAYRSPAEMQRALQWSDSIEPLLTNQHNDTIDWVGTRWAKNDLYEHIMDFYGDSLAVYTRSAIEDGEIIFPQLHTWEEYERLQSKNPALWYAQYENNPVDGGPRDLPYDSIKSYVLTPDFQDIIIKNPDGTEKRWKVSDLDRVICVDPNSGSPVAPDMAAIAVVGLTPDDETICLEMWSDRADPWTFCKELLRLCRRWKPRVVGIERAGQQNTEFYFKKLCKEEGYHVAVEPLKPQGRGDKEERVRYHLQPIMASGNLFLLPSQTILRNQLMEFPHCILWDEIDAFSYAHDLLRRPRGQGVSSKQKNRILKLVMNTRNPRTGY